MSNHAAVPSGWIRPHGERTLEQIEREAAPLRERLRLLDEEAARLRLEARLQAIATARNIMRSYDISIAEIMTDGTTEARPETIGPLSSKRQAVHARKQRHIAGIDKKAQIGRLVEGPMARLDDVCKAILARAGLTNLKLVQEAFQDGTIDLVNGFGPVSRARLTEWLKREGLSIDPGASVAEASIVGRPPTAT